MSHPPRCPVWRAWLLLMVAVWVNFAPRASAGAQVATARVGLSVTDGLPSVVGVHNYLYAHADPVTFSDPSGQSIVTFAYHLTLQVSMRMWAIGPAFAAGAAAVGRAYNALGATVQSGAWQIALRFPQLTVSQEQWMTARSRLDLVLELGRRVAIIESKYKIPVSGEPLARMTKQLSDALASGKGEVVLFVVKQPTAAEMAKVPAGVRVVVGYHDLAIWIERFFGIIPQ